MKEYRTNHDKLIQLLLLHALLIVISCSFKPYRPEGLRKLTDDEMIQRARLKQFINPDSTVFKDTLGNIIAKDAVEKLEQDKFFGDQYVNKDHKIVEVVIRRSTEADRLLVRKLIDAFEEGDPITFLDVSCDDVTAILDTVYRDDQENRSAGTVEDMEVDRINQQKVVSIIEKCGFPSVESHGSKTVEAAFLVFQHAGRKMREKYFPLILESAKKGDLKLAWVALMEDRMLMDRGEKQKYGSQVHKAAGESEWKLWPIEDPANVNVRRAEVGLDRIEDYLKQFDIDYTPSE